MTFRWSFVRSFVVLRGREGEGEGQAGHGAHGGRKGSRGPAFLRQHTGRPYRVPKRKTKSTQKWCRGGRRRGTRTLRPIKLQCPSKVPRRRQGSLDLPLLASFFLPQLARLGAAPFVLFRGVNIAPYHRIRIRAAFMIPPRYRNYRLLFESAR